MNTESNREASGETIVLKFGSSVLATPVDLATAVREVHRYVRTGVRVVAVVSAIGDTTDQLQARIDQIDAFPDPAPAARLLATGELQSAALLELELGAWGVSVSTLTPEAIGLRTDGPLLDAEPVAVEADVFRRAFDRVDVVVVPGFCGVATGPDGLPTPSLLGRGGSDLSALFLARGLGASVCLLKDTEGIYVSDPNVALCEFGEYPDRFKQISWSDAIELDSPVVQRKTLEFARRHNIEFDVARVGSPARTRVGHGPTSVVPPPRWRQVVSAAADR